MREVLWVVGAREEAGLEFTDQLQRAAARMLAGRTVRWTSLVAPAAHDWPAEARRHAFLFFKEALANVARHAAASAVTLSAELHEGHLTLSVADNGRGFDSAAATRGIGLASLRDRARALNGTCTVTSRPGAGTSVTLRAPVMPPPARASLASA
jgi:signal transduction histidine kinase